MQETISKITQSENESSLYGHRINLRPCNPVKYDVTLKYDVTKVTSYERSEFPGS